MRKDSVVLVGDGLGSRMAEYGYFEALVQMQYPRDDLFIRNLCDEAKYGGLPAAFGAAFPVGF